MTEEQLPVSEEDKVAPVDEAEDPGEELEVDAEEDEDIAPDVDAQEELA